MAVMATPARRMNRPTFFIAVGISVLTTTCGSSRTVRRCDGTNISVPGGYPQLDANGCSAHVIVLENDSDFVSDVGARPADRGRYDLRLDTTGLGDQAGSLHLHSLAMRLRSLGVGTQ